MLNAPTSGRFVAASMFLLAACSSGEQGSQEAASNPCAGANPCAAMNPCDAGLSAKISQGDRALYTGGRSSEELVAMGEQLWTDKSLSSAGTTSCSTCHTGGTGMMEASLANVLAPGDKALFVLNGQFADPLTLKPIYLRRPEAEEKWHQGKVKS